ncbi:TIGR01244 family sulfur transferase [Pelagibacterium xiamenense]|uniref:TIGR01244 family sulfur transferase n=1 Tax=Pelagibacterium xiamenense TaxID=2901140 RepID=UPI001E2BFEA2|nr:TIGR01244 family sulfur transferase [Pelagibacterium xiamenense]MCD7061325.1 TIGR01244 family phosphatase [Pelagibacterium xiamenense]
MDIRKINDAVSVSGQIAPEDIAGIKDAGFVAVVNNRPDGEAPDQPANADIAAAARAAGLTYVEIPMGREGVSPQMIAQTRDVLDNADGPVFCFCRSGTRSTTLWALSQAGKQDAGEIISSAKQAGYDISHLAAHLDKPIA